MYTYELTESVSAGTFKKVADAATIATDTGQQYISEYYPVLRYSQEPAVVMRAISGDLYLYFLTNNVSGNKYTIYYFYKN